VVGNIEAVAAVVAVINAIITVDLSLCAAVIVALIAAAEAGALVVANAFVQVCAHVDGTLIAQLCVLLKADVLITLCLALGTDDCVHLLLLLFALIQLNVTGFVEVLAGCCNGLYAHAVVWATVIANVCVSVCGPLLVLLTSGCLHAVLVACLTFPGGSAFVCACHTALGISIDGLPVLCVG
jgi:hypothetical protein